MKQVHGYTDAPLGWGLYELYARDGKTVLGYAAAQNAQAVRTLQAQFMWRDSDDAELLLNEWSKLGWVRQVAIARPSQDQGCNVWMQYPGNITCGAVTHTKGGEPMK